LAIDLKKGQRIDLTKGQASLKTIKVGLGWDVAKPKGSGGFFKKMFAAAAPEIDCDASVLLIHKNGKLESKHDVVFFGNLKHSSGSVLHMGDNRTGEGDGDDEVVMVELAKVPANIHRLVFVVNIYDSAARNLDFGMIENAFIRIVDNSSNKELGKFNLTDSYAGKTSLIVGEVYREENDWKFAATGEGTNDASLSEIQRRYS